MRRVADLIREGLHERLGIEDPPGGGMSVDTLLATEWCHRFERLQRNRMLMGAMRYGRLGEAGKPQYDRVRDILRRIRLYEKTRNLEFLVDIANLCQCEFVEGDHPLRHFDASAEGEHTRVKGDWQ